MQSSQFKTLPCSKHWLAGICFMQEDLCILTPFRFVTELFHLWQDFLTELNCAQFDLLSYQCHLDYSYHRLRDLVILSLMWIVLQEGGIILNLNMLARDIWSKVLCNQMEFNLNISGGVLDVITSVRMQCKCGTGLLFLSDLRMHDASTSFYWSLIRHLDSIN